MNQSFRIYKLDTKKIWENELQRHNEEMNLSIIKDLIFQYIIDKNSLVENNFWIYNEESDDENIAALVYIKDAEISWMSGLSNFFKDQHFDNLVNTSVSFIFLIAYENELYASTGGHASNYISEFIVKDFGKEIITRLYDGTEPVLQKFVEKPIRGKRIQSTNYNRSNSTITSEIQFSNNIKNLDLETTFNVSKELGIIDEGTSEDEFSKNKINAADFFEIKKSVSPQEFKKYISSISSISKKEPKLWLSYWKPVSEFAENGLNEKYFDEFYEIFETIDKKEITITWSDYADYFNAAKWIIESRDGKFRKEYDVIPTFENIYSDFVKFNFEKAPNRDVSFSKNKIRNFFMNWEITIFDEENKEIKKQKLKNIIDYIYITQEGEIYLNGGKWYILDQTYDEHIKLSFKKLNEKSKKELEDVYKAKKLFKNKSHRINEKKYNDSFLSKKDNKDIILADRITIKNVEICDLIVFADNDQTYLICNKASPTGIGSRDLFNQIETSANLIHSAQNVIYDYYDKLFEKNRIPENISKEDFFKKIRNAKYVAAFVTAPLKWNTESFYSKFLFVDTENVLKTYNKELFLYSPAYEEEI
ncbi:unknown protein [Mesoplasma florum L1]|uniref:Sporadically distributed protein, TIGR04141 family n=1 Tax=Mesoplasma florum (strain ATCC 33453 / NBRC 100688 / NCTC 11704 / L1) TaxID=265311 RepID=Q6F0X4_MESFL|nr:TIGR04141 family sporadically distributed protein [Mesoplasma florum]AAT75849.1 unknown protein [Mesoplasma florum L1]